jgi:hypothetical protein
VGSLFENTLAEIWHGAALNAWREWVPPECPTCAAFPVCHGGCRAQRELHPNGTDPCMGAALEVFEPYQTILELPADGRPRTSARMRTEPFGYVLLGDTHFVPIASHEYPLVAACDGSATFSELAERFGVDGLDLLGELWEAGVLQVE